MKCCVYRAPLGNVVEDSSPKMKIFKRKIIDQKAVFFLFFIFIVLGLYLRLVKTSLILYSLHLATYSHSLCLFLATLPVATYSLLLKPFHLFLFLMLIPCYSTTCYLFFIT